MDRRFTNQQFTTAAHKIKWCNVFWCTGKDSNLRTSLGGTDLQSVGFNHSPTCANFLGRCSRYAPSSRPPGRPPGNVHGKPADHSYSHTLLSQHRETKARAQEAAKITTRRKSLEWSALEKPAAPLPPPAEFVSWFSFPDFRFLELAKGFEPPTL